MFVRRQGETLEWEEETTKEHSDRARDDDDGDGPAVDYVRWEYVYPPHAAEPPPGGGYPPTDETLGDLFRRWPQNDVDDPPRPYVERLMRFDWSDPKQREASVKFRDAELPFKVYNVPEIDAAGAKWTDEYVADQFATQLKGTKKRRRDGKAVGHCQESENNFFCFFKTQKWVTEVFGRPPTMDNDFTFQRWAKHARYADRVRLSPSAKHYYWQTNVLQKERFRPKQFWTFISRDLPSFSATKPTYFCWEPNVASGIQCRFGERGVVAATHYDGDRNMIAMITGAKRYVLAPPNVCGELGIVTTKDHPCWRHSVLNFDNFRALDDEDAARNMSSSEREWLTRARDSVAVETVLKAGEVLYVPTAWFHYVIGLQKNAQCNVRSGRLTKENVEFGGVSDVTRCESR